MSMFHTVWVVCRKELKDAFRDRRALVSLVVGAVIGPLLVGFMFNRIANRQRQVEDIKLPVVGAEYAPALMEWIKQQGGIEIVDGPADPEAAVRDNKQDVVLVVPKSFAEDFSKSKPIDLQLVSDGSRQTAFPKVRRVRSLLTRYGAEIGSMRLLLRGVSPSVATAVRVEDIEVSSAQQRAAMLLSFLPLFIVLAAFTGGMQIATDSTAGERERGSLEPLLLNPAPREHIVTGKWLAAVCSSALGVASTAILCFMMLRFIPLQEFGVRFRLTPVEGIGVLLGILPMCLLATALQMYLSTFAKSFKEAQGYMGMLIMIPMLPGIISSVSPLGRQPWLFPIPIVGQHVLLGEVLGGRAPAPAMFVLSALSALAVAGILLWLTTGLFRREKIIFGR
ncbi:MAG: ABC transporter permease [Acidobacteria bacterium]|nr:ABC transporter permease [Acidobacteriota bacterium]